MGVKLTGRGLPLGTLVFRKREASSNNAVFLIIQVAETSIEYIIWLFVFLDFKQGFQHSNYSFFFGFRRNPSARMLVPFLFCVLSKNTKVLKLFINILSGINMHSS